MFLRGNENCDCNGQAIFAGATENRDCKRELFLFEFSICGLSIRRVVKWADMVNTRDFRAPIFWWGAEGLIVTIAKPSLLFAHFWNYLEAKMTGSICFLPSCAVITFHARDFSQVMTFVIVLPLQSKSFQWLVSSINFDRIKITSNPPPPQSNDEGTKEQKRAILAPLKWGGGVVQMFHLLSKIVRNNNT